MKRFSAPLFVFLIVLSGAPSAIADKVGHHGNTVDADGTAESCISCHDGSIAGNISFCTVKCDFRTPHVIMKKYPPTGKKASYASVTEVTAKGVRIVNGKVTCVSCHNLRNDGRYHLVKDERRRLCAICHIKEASGGSH
jgi:predicted CXXCH cytochrome family protein